MSTEKKHAYLIMAHNNFHQLQVLIDLLDDVRNDIYLHIDKKADFLPDSIQTTHAKLLLIERINVAWGGYSIVQCEMNLLKAAVSNHYQYYHFLSGSDLPLKSQDDIHRFFEENSGKEYIEFDKEAIERKEFYSRIMYWQPLQEYKSGKSGFTLRFFSKIDSILLNIQKRIHYSRKIMYPLYIGSQWVSITDGLANYLIENEKNIQKQFRFTLGSDEVFLHTMAMNSPYHDNVTGNALRAIDWERGNGCSPYTYRKEDIPELLAHPTDFWARKFDERIDPEAIQLVAGYLKGLSV